MDIPTQWVVTSVIFVGIIVLMLSPSVRAVVRKVLSRPFRAITNWVSDKNPGFHNLWRR